VCKKANQKVFPGSMTDAEKLSMYCIQFCYVDVAEIILLESRHTIIPNKGTASQCIN
jgi:hypothetical protein